ncbi:tetratricopeptide repeat protein [Natronosporangium hydrolyticum]|uniref:Tetratricopeptide repeat protein n=1 Tax=Natronosporangium hydrolyticum TaxID=2811111 RepID=A0A895YM49_9ACTN|nr:FxSxx-COOH system tetratricopeptide repeat protein [Natronosporangium hydrolyticum]QSB15180.1 tetratricopeptide repeat protein [Natronosporangium hydrolyticum]
MSGPYASGDRAVAAEQISGTVATGDYPQFIQNAQFIQLPAGGLPAPDQVSGAGVWNVTRRPSQVFVGRKNDLEQLARTLDAGGAGLVGQSVAGLGGVGKTELALHHAHKRRGSYTTVWWITADGPDSVTAGLASLARRLAPAVFALNDEQAEQWATAWLQHNDGWLLVLDNVDDPAHVEPLIGMLDGGHVLVTTRRDVDWSRHGLVSIRLGVLTAKDAETMLVERTGQHDTAAARAIAAELGRLPLALEQAAAYINHHRLTLASYRARLAEQPAQMHASVAPGHDGQRAITRVWDITLAALRYSTAVEVLGVLAWLAPDDVPRELVTLLTGDAIAADRALGLLASYSMITLTDGFVGVHRLVQAVLRSNETAGDDAAPAARCNQAVRLLAEAIPTDPQNDPEGWPGWRRLLPHITALAEHSPNSVESAELGRLLNQTVVFESGQGLHHQALAHATQALAITEAAYGSEHPDVATVLGNLASSYSDLGRPGEAVPLKQRALAITEAAYGPEHPDVAIRLGNLAASYFDLGRPGEAVPLCERALAITEAAYGPEHPTVAIRLGNLAASYSDLGRSGEAVPLKQRALAITEAAYGPEHPDVAIRLGNLAASYSALGRPGEAVPLCERALAITEAAYGPEHPDVATVLGNLASSYSALGRPGEAVPLEQRALAITEAAYGPEHPDVAIRLGNLAASYSDLGRPGEAVPLEQRALAITEAAYGPEHPDVAIRLGNLAASYSALGRPGEAVPLCERALAITEAAYGPEHPTVAIRLGNLAASYSDLGRPGEAVPLKQRALAITEAAYGPEHPDVAIRLGNLAASYFDLGRSGEAVPLCERALAITEAAYGPEHPTVAIRLGNLAASYSALGRSGEAVPLKQRALAITEAAYGPEHPDVAIRLGNLAASYSDLGRPAEAVPLCRQAVAIAEQSLPEGHPTLTSLRGFLKALLKPGIES